jgi:hypothetical protein
MYIAKYFKHFICTLRGHYYRVVLPFFSYCLINGKIFRKKLLNIKCVFIFSATLSETLFILRKIERYITINVHRSLCNVPIILLRF